jgi:hypothetical protein
MKIKKILRVQLCSWLVVGQLLMATGLPLNANAGPKVSEQTICDLFTVTSKVVGGASLVTVAPWVHNYTKIREIEKILESKKRPNNPNYYKAERELLEYRKLRGETIRLAGTSVALGAIIIALTGEVTNGCLGIIEKFTASCPRPQPQITISDEEFERLKKPEECVALLKEKPALYKVLQNEYTKAVKQTKIQKSAHPKNNPTGSINAGPDNQTESDTAQQPGAAPGI